MHAFISGTYYRLSLVVFSGPRYAYDLLTVVFSVSLLGEILTYPCFPATYTTVPIPIRMFAVINRVASRTVPNRLEWICFQTTLKKILTPLGW